MEKEAAMEEEKRNEGEKKRSGNLMTLVIIVCWVLFLYFFGTGRGPG